MLDWIKWLFTGRRSFEARVYVIKYHHCGYGDNLTHTSNPVYSVRYAINELLTIERGAYIYIDEITGDDGCTM